MIVYSLVFSTHLEILDLDFVFSRLIHHVLKLKPSKCQFLQKQVKYLGHTVSEGGVAPDFDEVKAVADWKRPETVRELHSFLGFLGCYRRFVKDFARIAAPLHVLMVGVAKGKSAQ